jgi:hypothetical protein
MAIWLSNLDAVLRKAGLTVVETPGWENRAYPKYGGFKQQPTHVMVHHTASNTSVANDLNYILNHALSPIGNIFLARDGSVYLIAAGTAVTNGKGHDSWGGGVPDDMMNHYSIAIEAANAGTGEQWPEAQTDAYVLLCAALCQEYDIPVNHVRAHFEWAPNRKIDPAGPSPWAVGPAKWNMTAFRSDVAAKLEELNNNLEDNMQVQNPPMRLIDTRTTTPIGADKTITIDVPVNCKAAMINFVAVGATKNGYVTAWGDGPRPTTSVLNYTPNGAIGNAVIVPVVAGKVNVYSSQQINLVADLYSTWA